MTTLNEALTAFSAEELLPLLLAAEFTELMAARIRRMDPALVPVFERALRDKGWRDDKRASLGDPLRGAAEIDAERAEALRHWAKDYGWTDTEYQEAADRISAVKAHKADIIPVTND